MEMSGRASASRAVGSSPLATSFTGSHCLRRSSLAFSTTLRPSRETVERDRSGGFSIDGVFPGFRSRPSFRERLAAAELPRRHKRRTRGGGGFARGSFCRRSIRKALVDELARGSAVDVLLALVGSDGLQGVVELRVPAACGQMQSGPAEGVRLLQPGGEDSPDLVSNVGFREDGAVESLFEAGDDGILRELRREVASRARVEARLRQIGASEHGEARVDAALFEKDEADVAVSLKNRALDESAASDLADASDGGARLLHSALRDETLLEGGDDVLLRALRESFEVGPRVGSEPALSEDGAYFILNDSRDFQAARREVACRSSSLISSTTRSLRI